MAQALQSLESVGGAEQLPARNVARAVAGTLAFYLWALNKGKVNLIIDGADAGALVREAWEKATWLVDRQVHLVSAKAGVLSTQEMLAEADGYLATCRLNRYGGPEPEDLEATGDYGEAYNAARLRRRIHLQSLEECAGNLEDRRRFSQPSPEFTGIDMELIWQAGRYRYNHDPKPQGREEGAWVAENVAGTSINGFVDVPWPADRPMSNGGFLLVQSL